ncbi:hypothetical protein GGI16_000232 [Coemansia sp. S142-1]|nr:hypothetical protein GGI16_000232 [Coemansia sp. S142-1]
MRHVIDLRVVDEIVIPSDEEGDEPSASTRASWEVLPDVGPSSLLGKFIPLSDGDHGDNADQNSAEKNGPTTVIHDSSGQEVTSVRVSLVFGSFFYMTLAMFAAVYQRKFGNQLLPNGADSEVVQEALGALEGFRLYTIQAESAGSDQAASLTVLMRDGLEFDTMRLDLQKRLGLTKRPISPIPAPLLFYSVAMLGCISLDQMSGAVLQEMLLTIAGVDFDTLSVVTDQGIRQMLYGDIFSKTKTWVHDLCLFAIKGGHIDKTLSMAATCHRKYIKKGHAEGNTDAGLDPKGTVAKRMLKDDVCSSSLLLGIRKHEFRTLFKQAEFMPKNDDDESVNRYMKKASNSLFKQS